MKREWKLQWGKQDRISNERLNCIYEGRSESKERFAIQRYLLIIGKK